MNQEVESVIDSFSKNECLKAIKLIAGVAGLKQMLKYFIDENFSEDPKNETKMETYLVLGTLKTVKELGGKEEVEE